MNREYNCKVSSKNSLLKNLQNTVGDYFFCPTLYIISTGGVQIIHVYTIGTGEYKFRGVLIICYTGCGVDPKCSQLYQWDPHPTRLDPLHLPSRHRGHDLCYPTASRMQYSQTLPEMFLNSQFRCSIGTKLRK